MRAGQRKAAQKRTNMTKTEFVCLRVLFGEIGTKPQIIFSTDENDPYQCFFYRRENAAESLILKGFDYLLEKLPLKSVVAGHRTTYTMPKEDKATMEKGQKLLEIGRKIFMT